MEQQFFKPRTVAKRWSISQQVLNAMIERGQLKAIKLNRSYRIPASELARIENVTGE
jgi:hypothetical protein